MDDKADRVISTNEEIKENNVPIGGGTQPVAPQGGLDQKHDSEDAFEARVEKNRLDRNISYYKHMRFAIRATLDALTATVATALTTQEIVFFEKQKLDNFSWIDNDVNNVLCADLASVLHSLTTSIVETHSLHETRPYDTVLSGKKVNRAIFDKISIWL
jgi:hypothetical protein